jgi:hypothetical protein
MVRAVFLAGLGWCFSRVIGGIHVPIPITLDCLIVGRRHGRHGGSCASKAQGQGRQLGWEWQRTIEQHLLDSYLAYSSRIRNPSAANIQPALHPFCPAPASPSLSCTHALCFCLASLTNPYHHGI